MKGSNPMKRAALLILAIFLAVPSVAHADEASKRVKIQELFTTLHMDKTMKQVMDTVLQQIKDASQQQLVGTTLTDAQQKKFDDFQQNVFNLVNAQMSWPKIEPDYIKLYDDAYTEEQIEGILTFYSPSKSQAMIAKLPSSPQSLCRSRRDACDGYSAFSQLMGLSTRRDATSLKI